MKVVHKRNSISYSFLILFPDLILCLLLCLTKHVIFGRDGTRRKSLRPGRLSQKDRRLLKMILVIFVSFLVCYLPITIVKVTHTTHSSPGGDFFSDCRRSLAPLLVPAGLHLDLPQHLHQPHHLRPDVHRVPTGLLQPPNLSQLSPSRDKVSSTQIYHVHSNFSLRLGR